jgi:hypothetical protein
MSYLEQKKSRPKISEMIIPLGVAGLLDAWAGSMGFFIFMAGAYIFIQRIRKDKEIKLAIIKDRRSLFDVIHYRRTSKVIDSTDDSYKFIQFRGELEKVERADTLINTMMTALSPTGEKVYVEVFFTDGFELLSKSIGKENNVFGKLLYPGDKDRFTGNRNEPIELPSDSSIYVIFDTFPPVYGN